MAGHVAMNGEKDIFEQALDLPSAEERAAFLKGACGADAALLERLQGLLRAHEQAKEFLGSAPANPLRGPGGTVLLGTVTEKPGERIGRYKLREKLGEGGCGVVCVA